MKINFLVVATIFLILASAAMAQTTTGAITGTVTDPSGAAIPSVKITATNTGPLEATAARSS